MSTFKQSGFIKEFYINRKLIGTIKLSKIDRENIGYDGRKDEIVDSLIICDNKRQIKAGTNVMTIVYPLNGKWNRD